LTIINVYETNNYYVKKLIFVERTEEIFEKEGLLLGSPLQQFFIISAIKGGQSSGISSLPPFVTYFTT
jgi:hypothetical protein